MLPVGRDLLAPTKWDDFLTHLSFANNPMSHYWTPTLIFVFLATIVYREGHTSPKLTLSFLQVTTQYSLRTNFSETFKAAKVRI